MAHDTICDVCVTFHPEVNDVYDVSQSREGGDDYYFILYGNFSRWVIPTFSNKMSLMSLPTDENVMEMSFQMPFGVKKPYKRIVASKYIFGLLDGRF